MIKVIAGKHKNKKLLLPSSQTTRGSKSILKESFFNIFQFEINTFVFIELFAGSGSMGIEAISRGAIEGVFFEKDNEAFAILKENIKNLNISNYQAYRGDTFEIFPKFISKQIKNTILYIDPPFPIRNNMSNIYKDVCDLISNINNESIKYVIIEHDSKYKFEIILNKFTLYDSRKYGRTSLSFFKKEED